MSRAIEERVLEMEFDNKKFESRIATTIKSLEKLAETLQLDKAVDSLKNLARAGKEFTLDGIVSAIDSLADKFNWKTILQYDALLRFARLVQEKVKNMLKGLTVDPLTDGWTKYEQEVGATQTIMNATGKDIDSVTASLKRLTWYSDETSYSYTDMIDNVGKFTAAGVDMDVAVQAMQGISNWAAVSGKGIDGARIAMYNFSQALGQGSLKLQDWKSIENANLATEEFKQTLIETAVETGTLVEQNGKFYVANQKNGKAIKKLEVTTGNLSTTLQHGWVNTETMLDTLGKYGEYTEQVFELAEREGISAADAMARLGDEIDPLGAKAFRAAQEAKTFTDALNATKDAVSSGWAETWSHLFGNYEEARVLWTDVTNVLWDVFAASGATRNELLATWKELGGRDLLIKGLTNVFRALGEVIEPITGAFKDIFPDTTVQELNMMTSRFHQFTLTLKPSEETIENLRNTFGGFFAVLDIGRMAIANVFGGIGRVIKALSPLGSGLLGITGTFGNWLKSLRDSIKEGKVFTKAIDWIAERFKAFGEVFRKIFSGELSVSDALSGFFGSIQKAFADAKKAFQDGKIGEFFKPAFDKVSEIWANFKSKFSKINLGPGLQEAFDSIVGAFNWVKEKISVSWLGQFLESPLEHLTQAWLWVGEKIGNLKLGDKLRSAGAGISSAWNWIKTKFTDFKVGEKFQTAWNRILEAFQWIRDQFQKFKMGDKWKTVTESVGQVYDVIKEKLSDNDTGTTFSSVWQKILGVFKSIGNFFKETDWSEVFKDFGDGFRWLRDKVSSVAPALAQVFEWLAGIFEGFSLDDILAIVNSAAFATIAKAFRTFTGNFSDIGEAFVGTLGEVSKTMKAFRSGIKANTILKIGVAIGILAASLFVLSKIDPDKLARAAIALVGVVGALVASMVIMNKAVKADKTAVAATQLLAFSASILIIVKAMKDLSGMDTNALIKGGVAVAALMTMLVIATRAMNGGSAGSTNKMAIGILAFTLALRTLIKVVDVLADKDVNSFAKGLAMLSSVMLVLSAFLKTNGLQNMKATTGVGLIATAAALLVFSKAIDTFAKIPFGTFAKGLLTTGATLLTFSLFANSMTKAAKGGKLIASAAAMALVGASLLILAKAMKSIATVKMGAIVATLGTMLVAVKAIEVLGKGSKGALQGALALGLLFGTMGLFFNVLSTFDSKKLLTNALGVSSILAASAVAMGVLSKIPMAGALAAVANLAILLAGISAIIVGVGALSQIPGFDWLVDEGAKALKAIGNAIGGFVGGIAGGFIEGVSDSFPTLGTNLSDFMTNAGTFFAEVAKIDQTAVDGVGRLTAIMALLTAGELLKQVAGWLGVRDPVLSFSKDLVTLGTGLKEYSDSIVGIDSASVTSSAEALSMLVDASNKISKTGGYLQKLTGEVDLLGFAQSLVALGPSLKEYGDSVDGFNSGAVTKSADAITVLTDAVNKIAPTDGLLQAFTGQVNIVGFAEALTLLGPSLKLYADSLKGFNSGAVTTSASALGILAEAADSLPTTGGLLEQFTGTTDLLGFALALEPLGNALAAYAVSIGNIDAASVTSSSEAIKMLAEAAESIPKSGGFIEKWTGTTNMEAFLASLAPLGRALKSYADAVADIDDGDLKSSTNALQLLSDLESSLSPQGGLLQLFTGEQNISSFGANLADFGLKFKAYYGSISGFDADKHNTFIAVVKAIAALSKDEAITGFDPYTFGPLGEQARIFGEEFKKYYDSISGLDAAKANAAIGIVKEFAGVATTLEGKSMESFIAFGNALSSFGYNFLDFYRYLEGMDMTILTGMTNALNALFDVANNTTEENSESLSAFLTGMQEKGTMGVDAFLLAFTLSDETGTAAGDLLFMNTLLGVTRRLPEFMTAGVNQVTAYTSGLFSRQQVVFTAARTLASYGISGFASMLPRFELEGQNAGQGFANGLERARDIVRSASLALVTIVLSTFTVNLKMRSPSKVTEGYGFNSGAGYANGLIRSAGIVRDATSFITDESVDIMRNSVELAQGLLENALTTEPTIRPVLDLDDAMFSAEELNGLITSFNQFDTSRMKEAASVLSRKLSPGENVSGEVDPDDPLSGIKKVEFNQFNTSPKALTNTEIYRQTDNQVSQLKELVKKKP